MPTLDRWALSELHRLVGEVTAALRGLRHPAGGAAAGRLRRRPVELVRPPVAPTLLGRRRRRRWRPCTSACTSLTLLLAPIVPFVTERVWQDVVRAGQRRRRTAVGAPGRRGRRPDAALVDDALAGQVALVRRVVELGRSARAESKVRNRQPLGRALVGAAGWSDLPDDLKQRGGRRAQRARLRRAGRRAGRPQRQGQLPRPRASASARTRPRWPRRWRRPTRTALARSLRDAGTATVVVDGAEVEVTADEVLLTETPREGWAVATEGGETVALDLELTPALRRAGLAREVVRLVQEARKTSGLRSPTASRCAGRPTASSPRRCGSTPRWSPARCLPRRTTRGWTAPAPPSTATTPWACASRSPGRPSDPVKSWSRRGHRRVRTRSGTWRYGESPVRRSEGAGALRPILRRRIAGVVPARRPSRQSGRSRCHSTSCRSVVRPRPG